MSSVDTALVERLAALPNLAEIPRDELEWLAEHGRVEAFEAGDVVAPKGERIENLWVQLSGQMAVRVDRGTGPQIVMRWQPGEVSGMLPYSRMKGPPGDTFLAERSETLTIHESQFPEMVHVCPVFTAHTVHLMLDRARRFNSSELQDEKMISLGKLAAGLAHELNNPASAAVRSARRLQEELLASDDASRAVGALELPDTELAALEEIRTACMAGTDGNLLSPIQQADREDEIVDWLVEHAVDSSLGIPLADTAVTLELLDRLADVVSDDDTLETALRWIAAGCSIRSLAVDIEQAATRIHDLVAAVKRFTYVDHLASAEPVDVETGLRDTLRMVASKAKSRSASVSLELDEDLPPVNANGGELNQVWLNLLDNALDAVDEGGEVRVTAARELDRVVVRVIDDGPGIPEEVQARVFDPFYTTKPPGQGTGLGLDMTRRLVRQFRGDISLESRPGRTEFRVSLEAAG